MGMAEALQNSSAAVHPITKHSTGNQSGVSVTCSMKVTNYGQAGISRLSAGMQNVLFCCHVLVTSAYQYNPSVAHKKAFWQMTLLKKCTEHITSMKRQQGWVGMSQTPPTKFYIKKSVRHLMCQKRCILEQK